MGQLVAIEQQLIVLFSQGWIGNEKVEFPAGLECSQVNGVLEKAALA